MTGRRLYDQYCDAVANQSTNWNYERLDTQRTYAWPFLTMIERRVWNDAARRITPKPRKAT